MLDHVWRRICVCDARALEDFRPCCVGFAVLVQIVVAAAAAGFLKLGFVLGSFVLF